MNRLERFAVGKEPLNGGYPHVTLPLLIGGGLLMAGGTDVISRSFRSLSDVLGACESPVNPLYSGSPRVSGNMNCKVWKVARGCIPGDYAAGRRMKKDPLGF